MTKSQQSILERISSDFRYRPCPAGVDPVRHNDRECVRSLIGNAAADLVRICPQSRELNHAINKLEEAMSWCHNSIDRHSETSHDIDE